MKCPTCDGERQVFVDTGVAGAEEFKICQRCNGCGEIPLPRKVVDLLFRGLEFAGYCEGPRKQSAETWAGEVRKLIHDEWRAARDSGEAAT
jgi:DnaJ-class molecular chaperone